MALPKSCFFFFSIWFSLSHYNIRQNLFSHIIQDYQCLGICPSCNSGVCPHFVENSGVTSDSQSNPVQSSGRTRPKERGHRTAKGHKTNSKRVQWLNLCTFPSFIPPKATSLLWSLLLHKPTHHYSCLHTITSNNNDS